ncbi:hypothetical protein CS369_04175 [Candidatus Symbiopectobacterium sp. 'North America']|uniref:hypothetical protein n=1 Tax=Candidatus Symbiopectobacterium sp. 'North America' TaxID=2794574 RepID=UPI0018CBB893|nr:hypothetical protein [Candidatus Symbiopectobacterium sp. 'North America']MBG6244223.1 hypothetical protein [Candidatus Symbiopectobacterium sp. 'North America']
MPLIPNVNNRYSLLTHSVTETNHADKKTDNNLIKQLFNIKTSTDKNISISNKEGNMEINILYPKKKFGIPLLFSISKQKKITISSERFKGVMLTPSKDPNNKMGININLITDQPSG